MTAPLTPPHQPPPHDPDWPPPPPPTLGPDGDPITAAEVLQGLLVTLVSAIGSDGTFVLLALAFGAVAALVVFLARRKGGVPLVLGLALGGVLGSLLAWGLGTYFGPTSDVVAHAKAVGPNVAFEAPLELNLAAAAMLAWPLAAMIVHLALTALFGPRDPEPEPWDQPKAYNQGPGRS